MKNILIFGMLMTLFLTSCIFDKKIKGNGNVTTEERPVTSFDKIDVNGVFRVYLTQGDTEEVEIEIDENLQQYVNVHNDGSTLVLDIEKGVNWGKTTKNNVYITLKNIDQLNIRGVCTVETRTTLVSESLKLSVEGVSNSSLELNCDILEAKLVGVGNTELMGEAHQFTVRKDGVGNLNASDLRAAIVDIRNSGVGSAEVHASQELSLKNSGVGSITYSGDAVIKSLDSEGVGKIRKTD